MNQGDLEDRVRKGRTIREAKLHPEASKIKVTWQGSQCHKFKVKDVVVLSCVHPHQYKFKHPLPVCATESDCLYLDARKHAHAGVPQAVRSTGPMSSERARGQGARIASRSRTSKG